MTMASLLGYQVLPSSAHNSPLLAHNSPLLSSAHNSPLPTPSRNSPLLGDIKEFARPEELSNLFSQRRSSRSVGHLVVLLLGAFMGWALASHSNETDQDFKESHLHKVCDPYTSHGILRVSTSSYAQNNYEPLDVPDFCHPINFMHLLVESQKSENLNFIRNRTVILFGDSVDRSHTIDFCEFVKGKLSVITADDPLSPPYPLGEDRPSGGGRYNVERENNEWSSYDHSRPYTCHVSPFNFTVISVFHFGFTPEDEWLRNSPHFYPPSDLEQRFTSIVLPLLKNLKDGSAAPPDLISITSGFWDIMRYNLADVAKLEALKRSGLVKPGDDQELDPWSELQGERRNQLTSLFRLMVHKVMDTWPSNTPRILWRAIHHPRAFANAPFHKVRAVDQIGRSVIDEIIRDDQRLAAHRTLSKHEDTMGETAQTRSSHTHAAERLLVNPWADLMIGQEHRFLDDIHPLPVPGSWLYWNIVLHQLRIAVDGPNYLEMAHRRSNQTNGIDSEYSDSTI